VTAAAHRPIVMISRECRAIGPCDPRRTKPTRPWRQPRRLPSHLWRGRRRSVALLATRPAGDIEDSSRVGRCRRPRSRGPGRAPRSTAGRAASGPRSQRSCCWRGDPTHKFVTHDPRRSASSVAKRYPEEGPRSDDFGVVPPSTPCPTVTDATGEVEPETGRATVLPSFDPETFARDSELRLRAKLPAGDPTIEEARRLLEEADPEQALFLLARLLKQMPLHSEANALSNECRAALERDCLSAIGSLAAIPVVAVSPIELKGFGLDHVSGFLLSLMDGVTDVEMLLDICGLPRLLALRHLSGLVARGIVDVGKKRM